MAIQTWLDKVLDAPELGNSPEVKLFLEEFKTNEELVEIGVNIFTKLFFLNFLQIFYFFKKV